MMNMMMHIYNYFTVFVIRIIGQQNIFISHSTYPLTSVGPDLSAADVDCQDEETHGHLGPEADGRHVRVQAPDEGEDYHEELEQSHAHYNKMNGCGVDLLVNSTFLVGERCQNIECKSLRVTKL